MFGYVVPNQAALSDEAQKRYRTAYCGLCRRIDALHGLRGRFTLSYDLTFLNLLLCSLYEGETEASSGHDRCPIHPLGGVEWRAASPTDYCADLSVALHYYNAEDKWKDDRSLLGLGYEKLLTGCKQAAESRAGGGGHDDLVFVEAVDVVHAGDDQALAPVELDAVGGSGGKGIVRHSGTS